MGGKGVCEGRGSDGDNKRESSGLALCPPDSSLISAPHGSILSLGKGSPRLAVGVAKNNFSQYRFKVEEK